MDTTKSELFDYLKECVDGNIISIKGMMSNKDYKFHNLPSEIYNKDAALGYLYALKWVQGIYSENITT